MFSFLKSNRSAKRIVAFVLCLILIGQVVSTRSPLFSFADGTDIPDGDPVRIEAIGVSGGDSDGTSEQDSVAPIPSDNSETDIPDGDPATLGASGIAPRAGGIDDYFKVTLGAPTSFQTYNIPSGQQIGKLQINVNIQTSATNTAIAGGKILLPLNPLGGDGTNYFTYSEFIGLAGGTADIVDSVTTDATNVIITLKSTVPASTADGGLNIVYTMDPIHNSKVLPGTKMWNPVSATLQMDGAVSQNVTGSVVTTSAADHRSNSIQLLNPAPDPQPTEILVQPNSISSIRLRTNNQNSYMNDFDYSVIPTVYLSFPAGTTVTNPDSYVLSPIQPGDGRVQYQKTFPTDASWRYINGGGVIGQTYEQRDLAFKFPDVPKDTILPVTSEFVYRLAGATTDTKRSVTKTYKMDEEAQWLFVTSGWHSTGNAALAIVNINTPTSPSVPIYAGGYYSYTHSAATKNDAKSPLGGVRTELTQPTAGSERINFDLVRIYTLRESSANPWTTYRYSFEIKDATGGSRNEDGGSFIPTSTGTQDSILLVLPTLTSGEYIHKITAEPYGATNKDEDKGVILGKNGFNLHYTARSWDDKKWPDGTPIPVLDSLAIMSARVFYNDASGVNQSKSAAIAVRFGADPVHPVAVMVKANGNSAIPGESITYEMQLWNHTYHSISSWTKPVVAFKAPKYLTIESVTNADGSPLSGSWHPVGAAQNDQQNYIIELNDPVPRSGAGTPRAKITFKVAPTASAGTYPFDTILLASGNSSISLPNIAAVGTYDTVPAGESAADYGLGAYNYVYQNKNTSNLGTVVGKGNSPYTVSQNMAMNGASEVKTGLTSGFQSEAVVPTAVGDDAQVRLTIQNTGNLPVSDVRLYDIIPYNGYLGGTAANFVGYDVPAGWTFYCYTGAAIPALADIDSINLSGAGWSTGTPADLSTVKAVLLTYSGTIQPGGSLSATLKFTVTTTPSTVYNRYSYSVKSGAGRTKFESGLHGYSTSAYALSFDANTGSAAENILVQNMPSSESGNYDTEKDGSGNVSVTIDPTPPLRANYTFDGWNTAANASGTTYQPGETVLFPGPVSVTLYATWTLDSFTVIFHKNGGDTEANPTSKVYDYNEPLGQLPTGSNAPTRTGYVFAGWFGSSNATGSEFTGTHKVTADLTLYARWFKVLIIDDVYNSDTVLSGKAEPSAGVTVTDMNGNVIATAVADAQGDWQATISGDIETDDVLTVDVGYTTSDITVKQKYYIVTFNAQGGVVTTTTKTVGYRLTAGTLPEPNNRTGYTFGGWATTPGSATENFRADTIITQKNDFTVYAVWTANGYTMNFDSKGGTPVDPIPVAYDQQVTPWPANPQLDGHTFMGWSTIDGAATANFNSSTKVSATSSFTVYAIWKANQYTMSFNPKGGSTVGQITVTYGQTVTPWPGVPSRTGYSFGGWATTDGGSILFENDTIVSQTANFTVYAIWTAKEVTLNFDAKGGTPVNPISVTYDQPVTPWPAIPELDGHTFGGWSTTDGGTTANFTSSTIISQTSNFTVYAIWTANDYIMSFDSNGGTPITAITVTYGKKATPWPGIPSRTGYSFEGWFFTEDDGTTSVFDANTIVSQTDNFTVVASWAIKSYTLTFNPNSGTAGSTASASYVYQVPVGDTLPGVGSVSGGPQRTGYTFAGWATTNTASVSDFGTTSFLSDHQTVYAVWDINSYTVTYVGDGTETGGAAPAAVTDDYNSVITVADNGTLAKSLSFFAGWKATDGTIYTPSSTFTLTEDVTLTAQWSLYPYYVQYHGNGNTSGQVPAYNRYNDNVPVTIESVGTLAKTGWHFTGWATSETGSVVYPVSTLPASITMPAADIDLYAVWERDSFTITVEHYTYGWNQTKADGVLQHTDTATQLYEDSFTATKQTYPDHSFNAAASDSPSIGSVESTQTIRLYYKENSNRLEILGGVEDTSMTLDVNDKYPVLDRSVSWEDFCKLLKPRSIDDAGNVVNVNVTLTSSDYSNVDFTTISTVPYEVTVYAVWPDGKYDTVTVYVSVADQTPPVIDVPVTKLTFYSRAKRHPQSVGELLAMTKASAVDNYDGNVTIIPSFLGLGSIHEIRWGDSNEYVMFLDAVDSSGNAAAQRQVVIITVYQERPESSGGTDVPDDQRGSNGGGGGGGNGSGNGGGTVIDNGDGGYTVQDDSGTALGQYIPDGNGGWTFVPESAINGMKLPNTGGNLLLPAGLLCVILAAILLKRRKKAETEETTSQV